MRNGCGSPVTSRPTPRTSTSSAAPSTTCTARPSTISIPLSGAAMVIVGATSARTGTRITPVDVVWPMLSVATACRSRLAVDVGTATMKVNGAF